MTPPAKKTYEVTVSDTIYSKVRVEAVSEENALGIANFATLSGLPAELEEAINDASMSGNVDVYYDVYDAKEVSE
jgi:hypothetical protein